MAYTAHCLTCAKRANKNYVYRGKIFNTKFYKEHVGNGCKVSIEKVY